MANLPTLVKKGLSEPRKIPPYIASRILPGAHWGSAVEKRDGYITFTNGGFVASPSNMPEFNAKLFYEVQGLREVVQDERTDVPINRSLELGCGYGRLTPWIAEMADESYAIEPNEEAIEVARTHFPEVTFENVLAQNIPFDRNFFDLVVSWTVLQHVPPDSIEAVCEEIRRVTTDDGIVVLAEQLSDSDGPTVWGRTESQYEELLDMDLLSSRPKPVEVTYNEDDDASEHPTDTMMVFSK